eukprot:3987014-Pyramimonas_sp.AAC.1
MANPDLIVTSRQILCVTQPLEKERADACQDMKGADETLKYYIGVADQSWLATLRDCLKSSLKDPKALGKIGFTVSFEPALRAMDASAM